MECGFVMVLWGKVVKECYNFLFFLLNKPTSRMKKINSKNSTFHCFSACYIRFLNIFISPLGFF